MIHQLAEKYWKGECSAAEEQLLKDTLRWGQVPADLEPLAEYLRFQEEQREHLTLDDSFDEAIMQQIANRPKRRRIRLHREWSIAASIALIIGMSIFFFNQPEADLTAKAEISDEFVDTFDNSEEAYREVKKALLMVSSTMNNGMKHSALLGEFDKQQQVLNNKK